MIVFPEIKVYHGSYCEVKNPDLSICKEGKDFGRGFYVTTSKSQASKFVKTAIKKAYRLGMLDNEEASCGYVSEYSLLNVNGVKIFEFEDADSEWLHCVAGFRSGEKFLGEIKNIEKYDIVAGKIANDNTNLVITAYIDGAYGEMGSDRADQIAIEFLEPNNLKDQICFKTDSAVKKLQFIGSERVVI